MKNFNETLSNADIISGICIFFFICCKCLGNVATIQFLKATLQVRTFTPHLDEWIQAVRQTDRPTDGNLVLTCWTAQWSNRGDVPTTLTTQSWRCGAVFMKVVNCDCMSATRPKTQSRHAAVVKTANSSAKGSGWHTRACRWLRVR